MSKSLTLLFSLCSLASAATPLTWTGCGTGLECSTLTVPLEYAKDAPSTAQASIALVRFKATVPPEQRLGSLLVNPGGPGGRGAGFIESGGAAISKITGGRYDIIGWDPRGVGKSTPLMQCFPNAGDEYTFSQTYPSAPNLWLGMFSDPSYDAQVTTQITEFDATRKKLADACVAQNSEALYTSSAAYIARDMASILDAVDGPDAKLNYWGFSYGTFFLSEFIQAFPNRVGRVLADGVMDPEDNAKTSDVQLPNSQVSARDAINDFISSCEAANANCPLATPPAGVTGTLTERIDNLFEALFTKPIDVRGFPISLDTFNPALWTFLIIPALWSFAANVIAGLETRNATLLLSAATASTAPRDPQAPGVAAFAEQVLACIDNAPSSGITLEATIALTKSLSIEQNNPILNAAIDTVSFCRNFPDTRPLVPVAGGSGFAAADKILADAKTTVLIVNPDHDPTTPLQSAQKLRSLLPNSSRLAIRKGSGHTSVSIASLSLTQTIHDFFVDGKVPDDLVSHEVDQNLFPTGSGRTRVAAASFTGTTYSDSQKELLQADYDILLSFLAIA